MPTNAGGVCQWSLTSSAVIRIVRNSGTPIFSTVKLNNPSVLALPMRPWPCVGKNHGGTSDRTAMPSGSAPEVSVHPVPESGISTWPRLNVP